MTLTETPEYTLLAAAMQDWPEEALSRVVEAPVEKWCAKLMCSRTDPQRCLLGHAEGWTWTARGADRTLNLRMERHGIARNFDALFLTHGTPAVLALQAEAGRILEGRR